MIKKAKNVLLIAAAMLLGMASLASAQSVVGNASLGVSAISARVALPAGTPQSSPYLMVRTTSSGSNSEVFYQLGTSAVVAAATGAALPPGGICVNVGPNTHLAAITATGTAGLRLTRLTLCPNF